MCIANKFLAAKVLLVHNPIQWQQLIIYCKNTVAFANTTTDLYAKLQNAHNSSQKACTVEPQLILDFGSC